MENEHLNLCQETRPPNKDTRNNLLTYLLGLSYKHHITYKIMQNRHQGSKFSVLTLNNSIVGTLHLSTPSYSTKSGDSKKNSVCPTSTMHQCWLLAKSVTAIKTCCPKTQSIDCSLSEHCSHYTHTLLQLKTAQITTLLGNQALAMQPGNLFLGSGCTSRSPARKNTNQDWQTQCPNLQKIKIPTRLRNFAGFPGLVLQSSIQMGFGNLDLEFLFLAKLYNPHGP